MTELTNGMSANASNGPLYLAFELGNAEWKLGFTPGAGQKPRERKITAADRAALQEEIQLAKERFGLPESTPVRSCYEAGCDGFLAPSLFAVPGIENLVIDSASIEVNRRAKRAKTDRLDVGKLVAMLIRYYGGEVKTFHYKPTASVDDQSALPFVVEFAFAVRKDRERRRLIIGINRAPTLANPFRHLSGYGIGLDGLLNSLHVEQNDPVTFVLHLACPHLNYTDRGKSSLEGL